jgi:ABC-type sulfate transport system substrate-binding protein
VVASWSHILTTHMPAALRRTAKRIYVCAYGTDMRKEQNDKSRMDDMGTKMLSAVVTITYNTFPCSSCTSFAAPGNVDMLVACLLALHW